MSRYDRDDHRGGGGGPRFRHSIYVGNVSSRTSERDIKDVFRDYGPVVDVILKNDYAFVEMEDDRDMEEAIYQLDRHREHGRQWVVEHAKRGPKSSRGGGGGSGMSRRPAGMRPTRGAYQIRVTNLASRTSWQDLKDWARDAGDSVAYGDVFTEGSERVGIVEFDDKRDYEEALKYLDGQKLHDRRVTVTPGKAGEGGSGGRDRDRDRRRSRSRSSRSRSRSRSRRRRSRTRSRSRSDRGRRDKSRSATRSRSRSQKGDKKAKRESKSRSRSADRSPEKPKASSAPKDDKEKSVTPNPGGD